MSKWDNLLAILLLLRSRGRMTAGQLAMELEVSVRTIYRYIDALSAIGIPVVAETGVEGGYFLPKDYRETPLFFGHRELVALFQAALLSRESGHPDNEALQGALKKLTYSLTDSQAESIESRLQGLRVVPNTRSGPVTPWLGMLETAVASAVTVELSYLKPGTHAPEMRSVDPYGLIYQNGLWYLVGHCHLRQGERHFRLDRIRSVETTNSTFSRPAEYELQPLYDDSWIFNRMGQESRTRVRVAGTSRSISAMCEHWYWRHCLQESSGTEATFQIDPLGLADLPRYLLTLGTEIAVLEPAELTDGLVQAARKLIEHHLHKP